MVGNKIIVIGCCGAGKSYFSRQLRDKLGYPLFYLDCMFWKESWNHITREELTKLQLDINEKNDKWIIDGNYSATLEIRMKMCDTIFFLDFDNEFCLAQAKERDGKKREDLPSYLEEKMDQEFIDFIKGFPLNERVQILELLEKYKDKNIYIFKNREEKEEFLKTI